MQRSSINFFVYSILAFLACGSVLSGCSALVSPYSTTFQCPESDKGKCVSVKTAYDESVEANPLVKNQNCEECDEKTNKKDADKDKNAAAESAGNTLQYNYQDSLYKKMTAIIDQPETPMVIPPDVMRVLIPSYTGKDNELFSARYVYFFVTEPQWSISSVTEEGE
ncbi:MAG: type IV conjugative transfer system protein TraV [Desulfobacterales bacterium CG23_combo_of_CG06-09_8_20_14_all_51_8]|nr:MAG: type IV conjugative transfer system protein TraV [Desulfobacterales bacterium CG23_combo_of_CG06-09_8_20_14_all_51_8]